MPLALANQYYLWPVSALETRRAGLGGNGLFFERAVILPGPGVLLTPLVAQSKPCRTFALRAFQGRSQLGSPQMCRLRSFVVSVRSDRQPAPCFQPRSFDVNDFVMAGANQDYSTLEVAAPAAKGDPNHPHASAGLEVARDDGKEYVPPQASYNSQDPIAAQGYNHAQDKPLLVQRPWWKKKRFFVTAIVLLVVIAVAVGVGVGVSLNSDSGSSSSPSTGNSPTTPTDPNMDALMRRNVAAVSLQDGSTNRTWVFYRNNEGQIVRSGATSPEGPWTTNETGSSGQEGSALAAAVSRPGFPLVSGPYML